MGLDILRYTNREINESFEGVCQSIEAAIKERIS